MYIYSFIDLSLLVSYFLFWLYILIVGGDLAPSLGDENIFGDPNFLRMTVFENRKTKFHFTAQNFWRLFFSHRPLFCRFFCLFSVSTVLNLIYRPITYITLFLTKILTKHLDFRQKFLIDILFCQFVLFLISDNSTSQNIGGTDTWALLPPQIYIYHIMHRPIHIYSYGLALLVSYILFWYSDSIYINNDFIYIFLSAETVSNIWQQH